MKFFKFLLTIFFWITLLVIIVSVLYYRDYYEALHAIKNIDPGEPLSKIEVLQEYFAYADQWNKIYIAIIISLLLVLFIINDHWIKSYFHGLLKKMQDFSYYLAVLAWCFHKIAATTLVLFQFIIIIYAIIILTSEPYIFSLSQVVEKKTYALLLGTNKYLSDGKTPNLYYTYRLDAIEELYKKKKVEIIIISGDKGENGYNEPMDMRRDLIQRGIPGHAMILDYAGYRTLDSIVRLKSQFGVSNVMIVSQKFHLQRALFLAHFYKIDAIGFSAQGGMTKSMIQRELLAKPKVILDIFVFNMQPKKGKYVMRQPMQFSKPQHKSLIISVIVLQLITAWFFINTLRFKKY